MLRGFRLLLFIFVPALTWAADAPFWKSKSKLYERVKAGEVIVSVTAHNRAPLQPKWDLLLSGGGHVRAPCSVVFNESSKFAEVAELTGYIKNPKYFPETGKMQGTISAFGFERTVNMNVFASGGREVETRMLDGPMPGFGWRISLAELSERKCEVSLSGGYKYDEFPIPRLFLQFGMEVILKRTAERLRLRAQEVFAKTPGQGAP